MKEEFDTKYLVDILFGYNTKDPTQRVLHSPFNIETHKSTFTNYLEVVITPDGVIEYAVPSHQQKLELVYAKEHGCYQEPNEDIADYIYRAVKFTNNSCPMEYCCDYNTWLCKETGYVMVWGYPESYIIGETNASQLVALATLKDNGVF